MRDFFSTVIHRWPEGRRDYHWHLLASPEWAEETLFEPYRELTHRPGLAPVRPENFHVTVLHGPPVEEMSEREIADMVDEVRAGCAWIAPLELTLGRATVGSVAIECAGRPGAASRPLWELTVAATAKATGGRYEALPAAHYPHASLAYGVGDVERLPMKVWLSDHGPRPVTMRVEQISLVSQWHDRREIMFERILDVPLGGSHWPRLQTAQHWSRTLQTRQP
ncbi:2'-5' RNA ligase family protein [Streptomyces roseochromogenus]|uniref:2'-5' RNA ligase n=1 Tax=Streptomyces roseochromogenus subsp. oscitans DS 12.976 TaxID=1352936 RepID=V6K7M0_STRRC|nr:hypothetical protein [Streptomyces roseochromogenus]EST27416.1 hypothetical protein M878_25805 [Streptomyces roseochromogenus subsp. oscitans DS 12.976]